MLHILVSNFNRRLHIMTNNAHPLSGHRILTGAFTLIELLIVVAIIAILAAIAVPNFLEAQVRAKVSRVKNDLRACATALEAYYVDNNGYVPGYNTAPAYGLVVLTSPVAYMTQGYPADPFIRMGTRPSSRAYTYEAVSQNGRFLETPKTGVNPFVDDPNTSAGAGLKPVSYLLISRGPDCEFGFNEGEREYFTSQRFAEMDAAPNAWLDIRYDPTNGTTSVGNITRSGGSRVHQFEP
jgi:prepilin-type N-terminal cleavage/methylation domain-containing protein